MERIKGTAMTQSCCHCQASQAGRGEQQAPQQTSDSLRRSRQSPRKVVIHDGAKDYQADGAIGHEARRL